MYFRPSLAQSVTDVYRGLRKRADFAGTVVIDFFRKGSMMSFGAQHHQMRSAHENVRKNLIIIIIIIIIIISELQCVYN